MRTISTSACVADGPAIEIGKIARQPRQHECQRHHGERDQQAEDETPGNQTQHLQNPSTGQHAVRVLSPAKQAQRCHQTGVPCKRAGCISCAYLCVRTLVSPEGSIRVRDCDGCNVHANAHSNFANKAPVPGEACAIEQIRASSVSLVQDVGPFADRTGHRDPLLKTPPTPIFRAIRAGKLSLPQHPRLRCVRS